MVIEGYEAGGFLVDGEPLLGSPGFWSHHLLGLVDSAAGAEPAWFGDDGADVDALSESLEDAERWPVFRVLCGNGQGIAVVYRNLPGDSGIDFLAVHPRGQAAEHIAAWQGELEGGGLTWSELTGFVEGSGPPGDDDEEHASRLLLLLPLLSDPDVPDEAIPTVAAALVAVGAPHGTASRTARQLLDHARTGPWRDPGWTSPLGGADAQEPDAAPIPAR
ncbi:hypothetical protein [Actinacidiphila acidipaludis]|uniref:SMI1/KNR4 family protein n=1 Tax=Actinacidiphila acidipaludis TaxID=2873382 RepID=A0ABS7Q3V7_9ACTN|nr:hypothetical protein [Streptomyces acidipaludis]MBY8877638.1 hypothetical protein [Streptomyces acidipaludis]